MPTNDDRVYTVDEARALLPQVRSVLIQLAIERHQADASHAALHRELGSGASGTDLHRTRLEADTGEFRARVRALLEHLESLGVVVRDLEAGLVDVPTIRDGERAWLCWRLDDPELGFWHSTREGYDSRQPL
jgi:hypothetical protein